MRGYGDYPSSSDTANIKRFLHWIREDHVGGFIVAGRIRNGNVISAQPFEMAAFINHMQRMARTPLLVGFGFRARRFHARVAETARFPYMMAFGAAHDLAATRELGTATAREARALGVNWVFAPDADVNNNPGQSDHQHAFVRRRSRKRSRHSVSAFIDGAHSDPSQLRAGHAPNIFPGTATRRKTATCNWQNWIRPKSGSNRWSWCRSARPLQHGADAIMTAHMSVPAFEPIRHPGHAFAQHPDRIVAERTRIHGLVVTDALEMQAIASSVFRRAKRRCGRLKPGPMCC